ncbi:hypothetical protein DY000_02013741 [Brassica cretica]|uniref:CRAL-TRIO domain-containing protein n=1 Tax=Brassica cretica TaxID=69181 RepID=A0ABQ7CLI2_BRACR|nr:hypothetical protein DY000_02013741 [Brassica cretica]
MGIVSEQAVDEFQELIDKVEEPLKTTFKNVHQGYLRETLIRFLKARDWNLIKAHTMNGGPITTCVKVLDMTGLKLSALSQIKLVTIISTIDDLNYPEKTNTYYVVNAPYIFSACWKVVKPLLQERTRKKVHVLSGCGKDELLKIMDYTSLPHFCRRGSSGSSHHTQSVDCFSIDHPFHQQLYNYVKHHYETQGQAEPAKQGSFHVGFPEPVAERVEMAKTIESKLHKFANCNDLSKPVDDRKVSP